VVAFTQNSRDEVRLIGGDGSHVGALAAEPGAHQQNYVAAIQHSIVGRKPEAGAQGKGWRDDGTTWTLDSRGDPDVVAYGLSNQPTPKVGEEVCPSLDAKATGGGRMECVAWHNHQQDGSIRVQDDGTCPTVSKHWGTGGNNVPLVGVRRLTPTECERLQGLPDGWTNVDGTSDSARYRQLGNAVAVPCAEWLGRRIVAVEEAP